MNGDPARKAPQDYRATVAAVLAELGIPADYGPRRQLEVCEEAAELVSIGADVLGREQRFYARGRPRLEGMRGAAEQDGIQLLVVSAFRSFDYQRALILRKLDNGRSIADILKINAAPGYSEHHSGRALDITAPDCPPLEQGFETTRAYTWLMKHAARHGFRLSYPRDNPHGISYEPWHWAFRDV